MLSQRPVTDLFMKPSDERLCSSDIPWVSQASLLSCVLSWQVNAVRCDTGFTVPWILELRRLGNLGTSKDPESDWGRRKRIPWILWLRLLHWPESQFNALRTANAVISPDFLVLDYNIYIYMYCIYIYIHFLKWWLLWSTCNDFLYWYLKKNVYQFILFNQGWYSAQAS